MTQTADTTAILDYASDDAATMNGWSDRHAATIIRRTAKTITVQRDRATRIDGNGASEAQTWVFERDYDGATRTYSLRKNGRWIAQGASATARDSLTIGTRDEYYDFSF
jgi:hypothetical protein